MTEIDLEQLKSITLPEEIKDASKIARDKALAASLSAFDEAAVDNPAKNSQATSQENSMSARPVSMIKKSWSFIMEKIIKPKWHLKLGHAAAIVVLVMLPLGAVIAWKIDRGSQRGIFPSGNGSVADRVTASDELAKGLANGTPASDARSMAEANNMAEMKDADSSGIIFQHLKAPTGGHRARILLTPGKQENVFAVPQAVLQPMPEPAQEEAWPQFETNGVKSVASNPVSTFSIDVDTVSHSRIRAMLNAGHMPPKAMVRVEEMINYFDYAWPLPETREVPFKPTVTLMETPWNAQTKLMTVAIKGYDITPDARPKANLVFLVDVSGSMNQANKLPLLQQSFRLLLTKLNPDDTVSIVTYAGSSRTLLAPTKASQKTKIIEALNQLHPGGSTAGARGIETAYNLAKENFLKEGINRVMIATDGDFNVGISDPVRLKEFIEEKRNSGIFLSVLGFGTGNYSDTVMQALAQSGNGQALYIDNLAEAQKALVDEAGSTLFPIAKDVKIQVEFNPAQIAEYRLIGYETRALKREDFNNDKVDAGDIGAGTSVTAIYELAPVGSKAVLNTPLRYEKENAQAKKLATDSPHGHEIAFLKLRYKLPKEDTSKLIEMPVIDGKTTNQAPAVMKEVQFATAVSAFGQKLRGNRELDNYSWEDIITMANSAKGDDPFGYRTGFVQLVRLAQSLSR